MYAKKFAFDTTTFKVEENLRTLQDCTNSVSCDIIFVVYKRQTQGNTILRASGRNKNFWKETVLSLIADQRRDNFPYIKKRMYVFLYRPMNVSETSSYWTRSYSFFFLFEESKSINTLALYKRLIHNNHYSKHAFCFIFIKCELTICWLLPFNTRSS